MMRRGGALYTELSDIMAEVDRPMQGAERQIFGWPSQGGVWVFRLPQSLIRWTFGDDRSGDRMLECVERADEEGWDEQKSLLDSKLRVRENMDGFCEVLRIYGAQYYKDVKQCPEMHTLRLLEPVVGPNIWVAPPTAKEKWTRNVQHESQAEAKDPSQWTCALQ